MYNMCNGSSWYDKRMLILLTPSKTMDFDSQLPISISARQPLFIEKAKIIAARIQKMSEKEIVSYMKVSPAIATNVRKMYANWSEQGQKPALWSYKGDVYKGMYANKLDEATSEWAEKHICIMSGLYGIVRPYDAISPYRLEMKTKLEVGGKSDLYGFWGTELAAYVEVHADGLVYNLCSDEYGKGVTTHLSKAVRIVTPVFYDERPDGVGRAPIYNKMMRGVVARWMIDHRTELPEQLQAFTMHGYTYNQKLSTPDAPAFYRNVMKPLVF